jgi:hypothetical protein
MLLFRCTSKVGLDTVEVGDLEEVTVWGGWKESFGGLLLYLLDKMLSVVGFCVGGRDCWGLTGEFAWG